MAFSYGLRGRGLNRHTVPALARQLPAEAARHRQAGRLADAITLMQRAATIDPANACVFHDLGLTCLEAGRLQEAAAAFRRSVQLRPDFAHAHWRLGQTLESGNRAAAIAAYQRAVSLMPGLAAAQYRLALLLEDSGQRTLAIRAYDQARDHAPKGDLRDMAAARGLIARRRHEEAEAVLRGLLAATPDNVNALGLLGSVLASLGKFAEATAAFERALDLGPSTFDNYYELVRYRKITEENRAIITRIQAALRRPGMAPLSVVAAQLALGKAHDDLGEYELAMAAFDAADEARRPLASFDAGQFNREIDRQIAMFSPAVLQRSPAGSGERTPVLVVGMPRSGTTLCEQILASHRAIVGAGELPFWNRRGAMLLATGLPAPAEGFLREAASDCLACLRQFSAGAARIVDKNPFNFMWIGLFHLAFPDAVIIHCRRAPISTALSIHQVHFAPGSPIPTGGEDLVSYYRGYQRMMAHWRSVLPAGRMFELDYEALTQDPEPIIRDLIRFVGLAWDKACLHPERTERAVNTPSKWQVKQPIYRSSVEHWRHYEACLGSLAALLP